MPFACVDHDPSALVNADVRYERAACICGEEQEVAPAQPGASSIADFGLADRASGKLDAKLLVDELRQAGAVERMRTFGSPDVGASDQARREIDDVGRCGGGREDERHGYRARDSQNHGGTFFFLQEAGEMSGGKTSASFRAR